MSTAESAANPWRYRCPQGHASWLRREAFYYCEICDDRFDELVDAKEATFDD